MHDNQRAERILDVSQLDPPEPFEQAVAALHTLQEGEYLRLLHHREPFPLYSFLDNAGFAHRAVSGTIPPIEIYIWRRQDAAAATWVDAQLTSRHPPPPDLNAGISCEVSCREAK
ncbi:hypothetical protein CCP3SC15_430012 [Gammaproteobacteria bacterium]